MRDKRMMTLTVVTALGIQDLAEIQANAALANGEITEDELKEMAIFLTHYLGFPLGSKLDGAVTKVVKQAQEGRRAAATARTRRPTSTPPFKMHSGSSLHDK